MKQRFVIQDRSFQNELQLTKDMTPNLFTNKILLITGGTGTFGNAVVDMALQNRLWRHSHL